MLVAGRCAVALADAGAVITLIRASIARELELPIHPAPHMRATSVTGDELNVVGRTAAGIKIGHKSFSQCMYVVEGLDNEVILGADYLEKLGDVTYNFAKATLKIGNEVIPMGKKAVAGDVRLVQSVEIPPLSEVAVVCKVDCLDVDGQLCVFEGENTFCPKSVLVGRSVDHANNGSVRIPVMNTSTTRLTIQKNTVVGKVDTVDSESELFLTDMGKKPTQKKRPGDSLKLETTNCTKEEFVRLQNKLNEYPDVVAESISELGRTNLVEHVIETEPGAGPVRSRPYNIPMGLRAEVKRQLDEMLEQGLISMSTGVWTSPIVLVKKKDNKLRFCVDYRKLNSITKTPACCLQSIENAMETMHGKRYFSALDLCSGFYQVELAKESREKSGFITPWGAYEWNVMPMGSSGSPATFQRLSMAVMADMIREGSSVVYLDDWLITSTTFEEHLSLLDTVFQRLRKFDLRYRLSKSHFCQKEILYLGHVISEDGIKVAPHNTEKITKFPDPKDKSGVRRLLGLFGFYRMYIANFAMLAAPLTRLTGKDLDFKWDEACKQATEKLKTAITTSPVLKFPDFSKEFILTTDASSTAIGAVLSQISDDGKEHPVSFYSKMLSKGEAKWSACEQELFAILCAIKHYRMYLMNNPFKVLTDNVACTYIVKKAELSPRLARWAVQLADYKFDIAHKPGKANVVADALSRAAEVAAVNTETEDEEPDESDINMRKEQLKDYLLAPIFLYKEKKKFPSDAKKGTTKQITKDSEYFKLVRGVLYRVTTEGLRLAIPVSQRKMMIWSAHDSLMSLHQGRTKTVRKLKAKYWWPKLRADVGKYLAECDACQRKKTPKNLMRVPLKNQMATAPFEILSVDFQGPFTTSDSGNRHILVWTDHFTKWCEMEPTKDQLATTVAKSYVSRIFCRFGVSKILISDRAKNFMSDVVKQINKLLFVDHRFTTSYHPQCNGQVEVYNKVIAGCISHVVNKWHTDWDTWVPFVQLAHNSSRHTIINASPSMLLMCREPRIPLDLVMPSADAMEEGEPGQYAANLHAKMAEVWDAARRAIGHSKVLQKKYYDRKAKPTDIKVGDAVLMYDHRGYRGLTSKLVKRWKGLYIVKHVDETNAVVQLFDDPDSDAFKVHLNNLKLYMGPAVRGSSSHEMSLDLDTQDENDEDMTGPGSESDLEAEDLYDADDESDEEVPDVAYSASDVGPGRAQRRTASDQVMDGTRAENDNGPGLGSMSARCSDATCSEGQSGRFSVGSPGYATPNGLPRYGLRRNPRKKREAGFKYSSPE